ncbi:glycosyltransferase family 4 protein [Candidatus Woesebacteria bacterium]|nr:MAG: glycosyltransferase family 4 protein [Candidatus Woesebacteria bacterium]
MRVLMIGWELPPHNSGGLGKACFGLAKSLAEKGVDITFVLPKKVDVIANFMKLVFADVMPLGEEMLNPYTTLLSYRTYQGRKLNFTPHDYVDNVLKYADKMKELITELTKSGEFDVIHAHDWLTTPAAIEAKKILGIPLVLHIHATEYDRTGGTGLNPAVYAIEKEGVEQADCVVTVSNFTKNILVEKYNVDPKKVKVIHNGVNEVTKKKMPSVLGDMKKYGYKIVLFLGRISLMKGPEYFIQAAAKVLKYDKKVIFVVAGSGDMQGQMMSEAVNLGIIKNVMFTGFLRGEEKDQMYQSADIFVLSSVSEPFGLTTLEAIANGTPVIISKQSGVSEVISHALKVDFWDTDEMANKILAAISYSSLRKDLLCESTKELRNLTWDSAANKCLDVYHIFE